MSVCRRRGAPDREAATIDQGRDAAQATGRARHEKRRAPIAPFETIPRDEVVKPAPLGANNQTPGHLEHVAI